MLIELLDSVQHSALPTLLDSSPYIAMLIQGFHLVALIVLFGLVLAFNTRVQGLALSLVPAQEVARALQRPYFVALFIAVTAGILLALPRLVAYAQNPAFGWKLVLLIGGAALQGWLLRHTRRLQADKVPVGLKAGAFFTLLLWLGTGMAGRAIGFV